MRGDDRQQAGMFSYLSPEERVPRPHPLRAIREMADRALKELSPQFDALYAKTGRPSIAPRSFCALFFGWCCTRSAANAC
jgi:hypothetical protein